MSSPPLTPAGSSSYNSDTMSVGDGTWDSSKNTFLLPNLVGLNFDTMRYNGMGNRFRQLPGYHNLIRAHGTIAAITFLFIVPTSIFLSRFYTRPRTGIRFHVWLNILTVLLTTVIFILGNLAVGPSRRLSNPHHGTGTAIFVLVLVAFIQGWWIHRRDWRKKQSYEPLQVTLHNWLGWAIVLLGLAQIPLGLTLYGSPRVLFILYALAAFALLVIFFILTRREKRYVERDFDSRYYGDGRSTVTDDRQRKGSRGWLKPALAGAGVYALANRLRRKSSHREDGPPLGPEVVGSRRHSGSFVDDEKYSYYSGKSGIWEDRLLKMAAPIGLAGLVTRYYDRRYRDRASDIGSYTPAPGGTGPYPIHAQSAVAAPMPPGQPIPSAPGPPGQPYQYTSQAGYVPPPQPLASEQHPLNRTHSRTSSFSHSYPSAAGEGRKVHGVRDGFATLGAVGLAKNWWSRMRDRREDRRLQAERDARLHGSRFTGDGRQIRGHHHGTSSISSITSINAPHPDTTHGIPPLPAGTTPGIQTQPAGTYPPGTAGAAIVDAERERERRNNEALPLGGMPRPAQMPQIPPDPQGVLHHESSSSESWSSPGDRERHRSRNDRTLAPPPPVTAGASSSRRDQSEIHQSLSPGEDSGVTSPPVSVRVKMHKDGRHVTLSRLPEAEAEARRRNRQNQDSVSTLSGDGSPSQRFRRRDAQEQQNAKAMRIESERLAAARNQAQDSNVQPTTPANLPAPPPIPESSGAARPSPLAGSVGSPGTYETDASTDYANNRRRRRAERARAKQAKEDREARTGKTVGFE